jgi:hypothetical protein
LILTTSTNQLFKGSKMTNAKAKANAKKANANANATASRAETIQAIFIASATARQIDAEKCKTIISDLSAFSDSSFSRQLNAVVERGFMTFEALEALAHNVAITDKSNAEFIGLKVITKVRQAINALANDRKTFFDGYTVSILSNLARLQEISNKSALVSLSKAIEYTESDQISDIKRLIDCTPSTASTQASSSRMMLRALGVCHVVKRKNGDVISFAENETANAVRVMFTM